MFKRLSVVVAPAVFFTAISLGLSLGLETTRPSNTFAEEAKCVCKRGCDCDHCRGKAEVCTNCNRCPDCLIERREEQRRRGGY
ncbi:MAG: hypothetical protein ACE5KK_05100 [Candidatus Brocadiales bacterium]